MRRIMYSVAGLALTVLLVAPTGAAAQSGWWEWALREAVRGTDGRGGVILDRRDDRVGDRRDRRRGDRGGTLGDIIFGRDGDDRYEGERRRGKRGKGPKFCSNGAGHPVHGRAWCRDKGFGDYSRDVRWQDRGWEDIVLDRRRVDPRRRSVGEGGLLDVLGDVVFGRVDRERRRLGGTQPLQGRWLRQGDRVRVLQIRSGAVPVAELSDLDGDGRVDVALVPRR